MKQIDFENGSVVGTVIRAAVPMLAAQILSLLYSIVDRMYIGRIPDVGTLSLGGIGLCFPVIILISAFTDLCGYGGSPLCAMERGKGNRQQAEFIMNTAFSMLLFFGVLITVLGLLFSEPLLIRFGASEETLPFAGQYLRIYLLGTIPLMLSSGLNPYINAQGFASMGMVTVLTGAVANILLDPVFIFLLHLGVRGAAAATVLSQFLSMAVTIRFLRSRDTELKLKLIPLRALDFSIVREISALGTVNFIMKFTNFLVSLTCNRTLAQFGGDTAVSCYTIITSVREITDLPILSFGNGTVPVISYNFGARHYDKLKKAIRIMTIWGLCYAASAWSLLHIFPGAFVQLFSSDPALIAAALPGVRIYFSAFVFQSLQTSAQMTFKALGLKRKAIFFSLFRKVLLVVPLTLLLPRLFGLGTTGAYMAEPVSNLAAGVINITVMLTTVYFRLGRVPIGNQKTV